MSEPKFCKDCKHYSLSRQFDHCGATLARNIVTGEPGFADLQRKYDTDKTCGPQAQWFEWAPQKAAKRLAWWRFWR